MENVWFFFKKAILGHFFFFLEILVMYFSPDQVFNLVCNTWCKSPQKKQNCPKMATLTNKSKDFIKARLTFSKSWIQGVQLKSTLFQPYSRKLILWKKILKTRIPSHNSGAFDKQVPFWHFDVSYFFWCFKKWALSDLQVERIIQH